METSWQRGTVAKPTRADAEAFALYLASKLSKGATAEDLISGSRDERGEWFALCPPALRCSWTALIETAERLGHAFIIAEEYSEQGGIRLRYFYDFEKGRLEMAIIKSRKATRVAQADAVDPKTAAQAIEDTDAQAAPQAAKARKAAAPAPKAAAGKAAAPKAAPKKAAKKERAVATLVVQKTVGGVWFAEVHTPEDGSYGYINVRKDGLELLLESYLKFTDRFAITKIDTRNVELTAEEKRLVKAYSYK